MFHRKKLAELIHMLLHDHSLRQLDERYLRSLGHEEMVQVALKLVADLKDARERLNRTPENSSMAPSSRAPWAQAERQTVLEQQSEEPEPDARHEAPGAPAPEVGEEGPARGGTKREEAERRKPGRQRGAPGHGRTQRLAVTGVEHHRVGRCAACNRAPAQQSGQQRAWTGFYTLDVVLGEASRAGLAVTNTKHLYYELSCSCGHRTRERPYRADADALWEDVALSEWRLVGPTLAALVVALSYRARMSRSQVREFLREWLGIELSVGTLQRCLMEAARASEALEAQLVEAVLEAELLHADETTHPEHGRTLWLWVFASATTVLFYVGHRTKEIVDNLLGDEFSGWLMSDGYGVYRDYRRRLRCWAHLLRKAKGLEESFDARARAFGRDTRALLEALMGAVYAAREAPGEALELRYAEPLAAFAKRCARAQRSRHGKTRELAVEFLRDWQAIFAVLAHPHLPLTNNEAERMLRHWVIWRRISYGTRSAVGSRAFALLASVIETCRRRNHSPWPQLAALIAAARQGRAVPALAAPATP